MSKKFYFVLAPYEQELQVKQKAVKYYGSKDYQDATETSTIMDLIKQSGLSLDVSFNAELMLIGASSMAMSMCDSIYVSKDWENDDYCKICHALAFSHGLDIVYEA